MRTIGKAYRCYPEKGGIKVCLNPHTWRCDPDETKIVFLEGAEIVELASGMKAIEYKKMIFTDGEIYTDGNKIIIYLYKSGDVPGNPTGKPVQVAEEVFG